MILRLFGFSLENLSWGGGFYTCPRPILRVKVTLGYKLRFSSGAPLGFVWKPFPNLTTPKQKPKKSGTFLSLDFWLLFGKLELCRRFLPVSHDPRPIPRVEVTLGYKLRLCSGTIVHSCGNPLPNSQFPKRSQKVSESETIFFRAFSASLWKI